MTNPQSPATHPSSARRLVRRLSVGSGMAALAGLAVFGFAAPASAHDSLQSSAPASGEVVTTDPGKASLSYSEELLTLDGDTSAFAIQVSDPSGAFHESGCLTVAGATAATDIALGEAGSYTVVWQVVSSDGHPTSGSYTFDYRPAPDAVAHAGTAVPPVCGEAWAGSPQPAKTPEPTMTTLAETPVATPSDAAEGAGTADPIERPAGTADNVWLIAGLSIGGLAVLAAVIVIVIRRIRHDPFDKPGASESPDEPDDPAKPGPTA